MADREIGNAQHKESEQGGGHAMKRARRARRQQRTTLRERAIVLRAALAETRRPLGAAQAGVAEADIGAQHNHHEYQQRGQRHQQREAGRDGDSGFGISHGGVQSGFFRDLAVPAVAAQAPWPVAG